MQRQGESVVVPTEQEQLHFSGGLVPVVPQVSINHLTPLHCSFVLGADRAAHSAPCGSPVTSLGVWVCLSSSWAAGKPACWARWSFTATDTQRGGVGWGGERRWQRRLVGPTTVSQLQSTHCLSVTICPSVSVCEDDWIQVFTQEEPETQMCPWKSFSPTSPEFCLTQNNFKKM